jgi:hypothetical protein
LIARMTRTLIASIIIAFLLAPVIICNSLNSVTPRMIVVVIASILFVATLSGLTKARTIEIFVAGAT